MVDSLPNTELSADAVHFIKKNYARDVSLQCVYISKLRKIFNNGSNTPSCSLMNMDFGWVECYDQLFHAKFIPVV